MSRASQKQSGHLVSYVLMVSALYGGPGLIVVFFLQEIGQLTDTIVDVFEFGVGVAHGHAEVGVTHGLLDDGDGDALFGEDCGVGVPQGVNVKHAVHRVTFIDSRERQVAVQDSIEGRRDAEQFLFAWGDSVFACGKCPPQWPE